MKIYVCFLLADPCMMMECGPDSQCALIGGEAKCIIGKFNYIKKITHSPT